MELLALDKFPLKKNCLWKNGAKKLPGLEIVGAADGMYGAQFRTGVRSDLLFIRFMRKNAFRIPLKKLTLFSTNGACVTCVVSYCAAFF